MSTAIELLALEMEDKSRLQYSDKSVVVYLPKPLYLDSVKVSLYKHCRV